MIVNCYYGLQTGLAVGVAVSLPWSTWATSILIALWLVAVLPTMEIGLVRRELATAAGGLPVLLWILAAVGMLWAGVPWAARLGALSAFHRLLVIPLLLAQFRRSDYGTVVLYGFLASATCLLAVSWAFALIPALGVHGKMYGVPVKDYISQSGIFVICAFALISAACEFWRARNPRVVGALSVLAGLFLSNIAFVVTSRTTLVVGLALAVALGYRQAGLNGIAAAGLVAVAFAGMVWLESPYLRARPRNCGPIRTAMN